MRKIYGLGKTDWKVVVWYDTDRYDADLISEDLIWSGARGATLRNLTSFLWQRDFNQGITYVDERTRRCVVVIGRASSTEEFSDTLAHEIGHLAVMISDAMNINLRSEAFAYLIGDITRMLWHDSHRFTCPKCTNKGES